MAIHFECKNCKKPIIRDEKKYGVPVRCSDCKTVNKTPSIAFQSQATKQQLELMHKSLTRHRESLFVFYISLPLVIIAMVFFPPLGFILFVLALWLLGCTSTSSKYLGRSPMTIFLLFIFLSIVFFVISITSYFRLKKQVILLAEAGTRE